ncbi:MAG: Pseudoazurin [Stenotrophomonas maltophilia]|nr:MAG: Pseudoazurin [Stenotrophomonas maltophilia]
MKYLLPALLLACTLPAAAQTYEVKMLTRDEGGSMLYQPDFLKIAPGDTVRFVPAQPSHNAASIPGLLPAGAQAFKSRIDQPLEVTFSQNGWYGVQCIPHLAMGMLMLIQVGDTDAAPPAVELPPRARQRLDAILARALPH